MAAKTPPPVPEHLLEYRKHLVSAEQKAQEDFDKTVLSLSGGALGISFVFLKDVIGPNPIDSPSFLAAAWLSWGASTIAVLSSYFLSQLALREAIRQVDLGTIYGAKAGGTYARWTARLNALGAVLFLCGVICIAAFAILNLTPRGGANVRPQASGPAATATQAASSPATASSTAASSAGGPQGRRNDGLHPAGPAASAAQQAVSGGA